MQGVRYGEMLKSARLFTRMGEGVAGVPCASTGRTPATTASVTDPSTVPSTVLSSTFAGTTDGSLDQAGLQLGDEPDGVFSGISFEDLLGAYGSTDILAS